MKESELYKFTQDTKEYIRGWQRGICPSCNQIKHLTIHHKIPKHFAKEHLKPTPEVIDYIKGKGNGIGLCEDCHRKLHEQGDDTELFREVIFEALGQDAFKSEQSEIEAVRSSIRELCGNKKNKDKKQKQERISQEQRDCGNYAKIKRKHKKKHKKKKDPYYIFLQKQEKKKDLLERENEV